MVLKAEPHILKVSTSGGYDSVELPPRVIRRILIGPGVGTHIGFGHATLYQVYSGGSTSRSGRVTLDNNDYGVLEGPFIPIPGCQKLWLTIWGYFVFGVFITFEVTVIYDD